jgi:hypothetical protein
VLERDKTHNCEVTANGARGRLQRIGSAQNGTSSFDHVTPFPDHRTDGAAGHVCDQAREKWLLGEVLIVLLEMLLACGDELDRYELKARTNFH